MPLTTLSVSKAQKRLTQCTAAQSLHLCVHLLSPGRLQLHSDLKEGAITGKVWNGNPLVTPAISYNSYFSNSAFPNGIIKCDFISFLSSCTFEA